MNRITFKLRVIVAMAFIFSYVLIQSQNHVVVGYYQNNILIDSVKNSYTGSNNSFSKYIDIDSDGLNDFQYSINQSSFVNSMSNNQSYSILFKCVSSSFSLAIRPNLAASNYSFGVGSYTTTCQGLRSCALLSYVDTMQFSTGDVLLHSMYSNSTQMGGPGLYSSYNCTSLPLFGGSGSTVYHYIGYKKQTSSGMTYGWFKLRSYYLSGFPSQRDVYFYKPDTAWVNVSTLGVNTERADHLNALTVYPNPGTGKFKVAGDYEMAKVDVYDARGVRLLATEVHSKEDVVDASHLPNGIYILRMMTPNGVTSRKIQIQKTE